MLGGWAARLLMGAREGRRLVGEVRSARGVLGNGSESS